LGLSPALSGDGGGGGGGVSLAEQGGWDKIETHAFLFNRYGKVYDGEGHQVMANFPSMVVSDIRINRASGIVLITRYSMLAGVDLAGTIQHKSSFGEQFLYKNGELIGKSSFDPGSQPQFDRMVETTREFVWNFTGDGSITPNDPNRLNKVIRPYIEAEIQYFSKKIGEISFADKNAFDVFLPTDIAQYLSVQGYGRIDYFEDASAQTSKQVLYPGKQNAWGIQIYPPEFGYRGIQQNYNAHSAHWFGNIGLFNGLEKDIFYPDCIDGNKCFRPDLVPKTTIRDVQQQIESGR
jgi:hypothetical protein